MKQTIQIFLKGKSPTLTKCFTNKKETGSTVSIIKARRSYSSVNYTNICFSGTKTIPYKIYIKFLL